MSNTNVNISLNGNQNDAVKEWEDLEFIATFENQNAQPNITVNNELTFVNEYAEAIQAWIDGGFITEGMPLQVTAFNSQNTFNVFDGVVDFTDEFRRIDPTTFKAKIKPAEGLNRLDDRASGLTFQYLYDIGVIQDSDFINVPYVVEKELDFVELAMLTLGIFLMIDKLQQLIKELSKDITNLVAHTTGGATGPAASIIASATFVALDIAYTAIVLVSLITMIQELISYMLSPVKFHKAIRLNVLMEKAANFLGYGYNSGLGLDEIVFMPSKREIIQDNQVAQLIANLQINQPGVGIPTASDYGYTFAEMLDAVNKVFKAKVAIQNGVIQQQALISSYWIQQSSYVLPDPLVEQRQYNLDELNGTKLIQFQTDTSEYWTIENFDGTVAEIRTSQANVNNSQNELIKGFENVDIPYALGTRKEGLTKFEETIRKMAKVTDDLINFFDGVGNNEAKVTARVGMLKLGRDWFDVPKLMKMNSSNKFNANYRDIWSAEYLWNTYHIYDSWATSNPNQWLIFENVKVKFGFEDFLKVINNSYFYDSDGNECKIDKCVWSPNKDFAVITYRQKFIYQQNINEQVLT